jgi:hypothetical protein
MESLSRIRSSKKDAQRQQLTGRGDFIQPSNLLIDLLGHTRDTNRLNASLEGGPAPHLQQVQPEMRAER